MRITMRTLCAGPHGTMRAGITYDVPEAFATDLVAGGYATREDEAQDLDVQDVEVSSEPDTAELTEEQEEDITLPRGRRRAGGRGAE